MVLFSSPDDLINEQILLHYAPRKEEAQSLSAVSRAPSSNIYYFSSSSYKENQVSELHGVKKLKRLICKILVTSKKQKFCFPLL
jgi:hypothetical protein